MIKKIRLKEFDWIFIIYTNWWEYYKKVSKLVDQHLQFTPWKTAIDWQASKCYIFIDPRSKSLLDTVVHETYHAVRGVFENKEVSLDEELTAYYLGYYSQYIYNLIVKEKWHQKN